MNEMLDSINQDCVNDSVGGATDALIISIQKSARFKCARGRRGRLADCESLRLFRVGGGGPAANLQNSVKTTYLQRVSPCTYSVLSNAMQQQRQQSWASSRTWFAASPRGSTQCLLTPTAHGESNRIEYSMPLCKKVRSPVRLKC